MEISVKLRSSCVAFSGALSTSFLRLALVLEEKVNIRTYPLIMQQFNQL